MLNKSSFITEKIIQLQPLQQKVSAWRLKGESVVFTNGCFDLLHPGHLEVLLSAANEGNRLVVGLNSDLSVKKLKGESRPLIDEKGRALLLAAQTFVDAVVLFEEETPLKLIEAIRPDVLVKGGDYKEEAIAGASLVKSYNGKVHTVPLLPDFSTTRLINKIKNTTE